MFNLLENIYFFMGWYLIDDVMAIKSTFCLIFLHGGFIIKARIPHHNHANFNPNLIDKKPVCVKIT